MQLTIKKIQLIIGSQGLNTSDFVETYLPKEDIYLKWRVELSSKENRRNARTCKIDVKEQISLINYK